jgi:hypothetical protein
MMWNLFPFKHTIWDAAHAEQKTVNPAVVKAMAGAAAADAIA